MKKSVLSLLVGLSVMSSAHADDLMSIYQLAIKNDPQVLKAAANANVSKQGVDQAFSSFLPQISFSAGYTKTYGESEFNTNPNPIEAPTYVVSDTENTRTNYNFRLDQSLFNMSDWEQLDIAEKRNMQNEASYALAQQSLIVRVSQAYFNVLKAKDDLTFVDSEKRAIERQLEQTKQRFAVGLTAITDVHEAQAQFDNAVAQQIRAENDVEIKTELLREITNQYHKDLSMLDTARFSVTSLSKKSADFVQLAEQQNLELKIQQLSVEVAQLNIDNAQTGHYPTLSLTASTGSSDSKTYIDVADFTNNPSPSDSSSIGINLSVPIYSGGRTSAAVKSAQASYVAASEDMEQTHRKVSRSVRSSYADVSSLVPALRALNQAVVSAESALQATEAGFEVGTRTIVDVLQSTRNLFNAKRNLSSTRYDYILANLALKQAAGTLTGADVAAINQGLIKK